MCHMLVLIIGGRYGSPSSTKDDIEDNKKYYPAKSVTVKEYQSARDKDIPIFIFIERNVYSEYRTYLANKCNPDTNYAYVDNVKVFEFIGQVLSQRRNNPVCEFDKFEEISNWLRDQWAGLFAEHLRQRQEKRTLISISAKIDELSQISETLRTYTESLMMKVQPEGFNEIIETESKKIEEAIKKKDFYENRFTDVIMSAANIRGIYVRVADIYRAFVETSTIEEFLSKLGFSDKDIENMMHICSYYEQYAYLKYGITI